MNIRLVGAVLAVQNAEWAEGRCLVLDVLARLQSIDATDTEEVIGQPTIRAITA